MGEASLLWGRLGLGVFSLVALCTLGGAVFTTLERDAELAKYQKNRFFFKQMEDLWKFEKCDEEPYRNNLDWCKNQEKFGVVLTEFFDRNGNEMYDSEKWTFFGSIFFVYTLGTSLGYGTLHPETGYGKLMTVGAALVTIPIAGYVLSLMPQLFVLTLAQKNKKHHIDPLVICGLSFVFFLFLGGIMYSQVFEEPWTFVESLYFSAGTLFTIGFGDQFPSAFLSKLFTMFYIFCGLGVTSIFVALTMVRLDAFVQKQLALAKRLEKSDSNYGSTSTSANNLVRD